MPFAGAAADLGGHARLLLYSDGVFEIEKPDGVMWTLEEFVAHVAAQPPEEPLLEPLLAHVRRLRGGPTLADDFSALEVRF
jgi:sigma-B regulation protein RsbU (phosphoserine phosphatase)